MNQLTETTDPADIEITEWQAGICLDGSSRVRRHYGKTLRGRTQEVFMVAALDSRHRLIEDRMIALGGLTQCVVDLRVIYRFALIAGAAAIVCVHNHPSGDVTPSADDVVLTRRIEAAGITLGCHLLDHVIVGEGYYSFAERGLITNPEGGQS